jgi:hypothetical protein
MWIELWNRRPIKDHEDSGACGIPPTKQNDLDLMESPERPILSTNRKAMTQMICVSRKKKNPDRPIMCD